MAILCFQVVEALQLTLEQQSITLDQQAVCNLLQACKAWRAAVQQCKSGQVGISVKADGSELLKHNRWLQRLAAATSWLSKHVGLMGSLTMNSAWTGLVPSPYCIEAINRLAPVLQAAAPQMRKPWSLHTDVLTCSLLSSLVYASSSLTSLEFTGLAGNWFGVAPMVTQLSNLQQLSVIRLQSGLYSNLASPSMAASNLVPLSSLQRLTTLEMHHPASCFNAMQLPSQLIRLTVLYGINREGSLACMLQRLPQLQQLTAEHWMEHGSLQELEHLAPQLTTLTEVQLRPEGTLMAVKAGSFLGLLPTLQSLCIQDSDRSICKGHQYLDFLKDLAATSSLKKLELDVNLDVDWLSSGVFEQIAKLTTLQHLFIYCCPAITCEGAQHLAQLKSLTYLELPGVEIDNAGLSLLALKLTNLRHLSIMRRPWPSVGYEYSVGVMPVVAQLSSLTYLSLGGLMDVDTVREGLKYMTGLSQLKQLKGVFEEAGEEALATFWAAVHSRM